ncbi:MAG TPA: hypothetical protein VM431_14870 [Phycisphaerae bacterium]|nr:hypothetical protein [Phycisphaerae bacterium]
MAKRDDRSKPKPPKFPRRRWSPGQVERTKKPDKGGAYDRARRRREETEEVDESAPGDG